jgi:hypothetical protein
MLLLENQKNKTLKLFKIKEIFMKMFLLSTKKAYINYQMVNRKQEHIYLAKKDLITK